jgi:Ca2+-binding RTX toxin-like protein
MSTEYVSVLGGTGTDQLTLSGTNANTINLTTVGIEWISAGNGSDNIDGSGQLVALTIDGNDGDDVLKGGAASDSVYGREGDNTIAGNAGNDYLYAGSGNDAISGGTGDDTIDAGTGNNTIDGGTGANQIYSGAGVDSIIGGDGNDTIYSRAGADTITGGLGNDYIDAGTGKDTAVYATATAGVTVNLNVTSAQNTGGAGSDTLLSVENLVGSNFNDNLVGNGGNNILTGGGGNDSLDGGAGTDTASYGSATAGVTVNLSLGAQNTVGAGTDTLINVENLTGSTFNDTLLGNAGNNVLNGGAGIDTVSYANATAGVTVNLGLTTGQNTVGAGTDTLVNFENLTGSNFNDSLTGNSVNNTLIGGLGIDQLNGGAGIDTLTGNSGADSFIFNTTLNATTNKDSITDFNVVDDTLVLENAIFTKFTATGALPAGTFVSGAGAVAADANDFLVYNTTTGSLSYDADGNGAGAAVAFVTLVGSPALTAGDFTII